MPRVAPAAAVVESAAPPPEAPVAKKQRTANPGVRHQGGRIYDSENGTTCHQCRQKTVEVKAKCTKCTLYFCPRCLENRYKQFVAEVNALGDWQCPRCTSICNCSNCRKKQGLEATGILASVARTAGFESVSELLAKNPTAKGLSMLSAERRREGSGAAPAVKRARTGAAAMTAATPELLVDTELGPRPDPLPEVLALCVALAPGRQGHKAPARRGGAGWAASLPARLQLPAAPCLPQLLEVLEFVEAFSGGLKLRGLSTPLLAAELLLATAATAPDTLSSQCAALHCRLLETVREAWEVKGPVAPTAWQPAMLAYLERWRDTPSQSAARDAPAAVAGHLATLPPGAEPWAARACAPATPPALTEYPAGGYWGLAAETRVAMLHALVHDALDTWRFREIIEKKMEVQAEESKERKAELAQARKATRAAILAARDQEIAVLVASCDGRSMTLEEQAALVAEARARAEAAAAASGASSSQPSEPVYPFQVRARVLGVDREGRRVLQTASGSMLVDPGVHGAVLLHSLGNAEQETFAGCADVPGLMACMDARGKNESALLHSLARAFHLPLPGQEMVGAPARLPARVDDMFARKESLSER
uniref:Zinc-finger domain-containing protein n=1 Tax=Auxenochlorella protothecoides TaxID=3075 RepID=A0A1D1ZVX1_AUXPR